MFRINLKNHSQLVKETKEKRDTILELIENIFYVTTGNILAKCHTYRQNGYTDREWKYNNNEH